MIEFIDQNDFYAHVIGQKDCCDYEESGYVAVFKNGVAAITRYSHCSCYGTWTDLLDKAHNPRLDWCGTIDELVEMAKRTADIIITEREADTSDYDYEHLVDVYDQVIKWYNIGCFSA